MNYRSLLLEDQQNVNIMAMGYVHIRKLSIESIQWLGQEHPDFHMAFTCYQAVCLNQDRRFPLDYLKPVSKLTSPQQRQLELNQLKLKNIVLTKILENRQNRNVPKLRMLLDHCK